MGDVILKRFSKRTVFVLLVCFVALVGAVAAYAYLVNNHPSVELSRKDVSNGLVLEIDKTVYERGENVTITFTNNSTKTVAFPDYAWATIRDSEGHLVGPGLWEGAILNVPAGDSLIWVWEQRDPGWSLVPPGIYTINMTVYAAGLSPKLADLSVKFEIV